MRASHAGLVVVCLLGACHADAPSQKQPADADAPQPPKAAIKPFSVLSPNGARTDNYYWLRDDKRQDPEMLAYLKAENQYKEAMLAPLAKLRETLYQEIVARIPAADSTVPVAKNGYWYYQRFEPNKDQPLYARKKGALTAAEEVLIDGNARAVGQSFYRVGEAKVSPNTQVLAFTEDLVGRLQYSLRFRDLSTGKELPDRIDNVEPDIAWLADNRSVLYIEKDPQTLLSTRVRKHVIGTDPKQDVLLYEEPDKAFYIGLRNSKSDRYVLVNLASTEMQEFRYLPTSDLDGKLRVFFPREKGHLYEVENLGDRWLIRTNFQAPNYRIMSAKMGDEGKRNAWRDLLPHKDDVFIEEFDGFKDYLVVSERAAGVRRLRVRSWDGKKDSVIAAAEPAYTTSLGQNWDVNSNTLRYIYSSLKTPNSTFDYDLVAGKAQLMKREEVVGNFDPANYTTELAWATARDGTQVPVSIVYRNGFKKDGTAPLLQFGYGAYGNSYDAEFTQSSLSLLDRGVVIAIAHIRGGQELGRKWYDAGRLRNKKNTFTDFIDVTRFLVQEKYAAKDRVAAFGRSAGGLLMGAVANMAPQDYKLIVTQVPFVDAVTTELDDTIPLTSNEYDEWGNPKNAGDYEYILSYSPYDNVKAQTYPAMFVTTGLWDSQVQYWEPAKWVAKLRATKTDHNPLLFRVDMGAGHGGKPGRFERYRERAEWYAFLLSELGAAQ
jgi:oligopeptidase B